MLNVLDIASEPDAVPVNLAGQGDHAVIVAVPEDFLHRCDSLRQADCYRTFHHADNLTRPSTTCAMLCTEAKVAFLSTSSGNSTSNASSSASMTSTDASDVRPSS